MNAIPHALATALAGATPHAMSRNSVHAKRREGKRREGKGRHHTSPHQNFSWVTSSSSRCSYVPRASQAAMMMRGIS